MDYIGFTVMFEHRFDATAPRFFFEVMRDECRLHISEFHGDAAPGQAEISARGHKRLNPGINLVPWGFKEVSLANPFYNRLVFCERT